MIDFPKSTDEQPRSAGGQHRPAEGTSTADRTDRERDAEALASFNEAWQLIRYGQVSGCEW